MNHNLTTCDMSHKQLLQSDGIIKHVCEIPPHTKPNNKKCPKENKVFPCDTCGKNFSTKSHLKIHFRIHTGEKPFPCLICNKAFNQKICLTLHLRLHTGEKPFQCKSCNRRFADPTSFRIHKLIHTGVKPHSCTMCQYKCYKKNELKCHLRVHTGEKPYSCDKCFNAFLTHQQLVRHQITHEKPHKCDKCQKRFRLKEDLYMHLENHIKKKSDFSCHICNKKLKQESSLKNHLQRHIKYSCQKCNKSYCLKSNLENHVKVHTAKEEEKKAPYTCFKCHKNFFSKSDLTEHALIHIHMKLYICDICHEQYPSSYLLFKHSHTEHPGAFSVTCSHCKQLFCDKTVLRTHVCTAAIEVYRCDVCSKATWSEKQFIKHVKACVKPYCDACQTHFYTSIGFNHHLSFCSGKIDPVTMTNSIVP